MTFLILLALAALIYLFLPGARSIAPNREYKSGTIWCFWRWTKVDSEYITRLHVVKTPWFAVCLHWINKPDAEPWLHDHPVSFLSVILRGGYAELRQTIGEQGPRYKVNRWFNFVRADPADRHRIILARKNTLTLCFMGPKTREWGFHTRRGWVMWKDYYAKKRAEEAPLDKYTGPVFWKTVDDGVTAMTDRFIGAHDGKVFLDEDKRAVDGDFTVSREDFYKTFTMDFGDEDPTEPRR